MALLISACLLGEPCRYDGASKPLPETVLSRLREEAVLVPVCPERLGGLPTPRPPAERRGSRVVTADGADVTEAYRLGAQKTLAAARASGCKAALLKARSPACGCGGIYDGTHTHTLTKGDGFAAALLRKSGVAVFTEEEPEALERALAREKEEHAMEFRSMARGKQALPPEECIEILKKEPRGVLSVIGEGGYPYGVPLDHWYCEEDGRLYFHSGKTGHKIDAMRADPRASFCVCDAGERTGDEWWLTVRSVVVFGRLEIVEDPARAIEISRALSYKYTADTAYIEEEIRRSGAGVLVFSLTPEHITGKRVREK